MLDGSLAYDLFAVVGAPKAVTTSLHHYLGQHTDVCMSIPKEPHFFDVFYSMGAKAYIKDCFAHRAGQLVVGECTTSSLALPFVPARIRAAFPEARIVACLREPLDRAYSAWRMHQRDGTESRSFEQAIQDNAERLHSGFHWHGEDGAARWRFMFEQYVRYGRLPAPTYLEFGQYGPQLQRYLEYFPRDQLAVVLFEGLRRDTEQVVRRIWEFLEIDPGIVRRLDLEPRNMANSPKRPPNLPVGLKE